MQVALCDVCNGKDAEAYEVSFPDGVLRADLCKKDAKPLLDLRKTQPTLFVPAGKRRRTPRIRVEPGAV